MIKKKLYKVIQAMELGILVKSNGYTFGLMDNHNIGMQMSKVVGDGEPEKVWHDCLHCPLIDNCDETAMVLELATA